MPSKPKSLVCYICGREFGTASLGIHLKACRKKWDAEQEKRPAHQRKACPQPPAGFEEAARGLVPSDSALGKYNDAAFDSYNHKALEPCPRCGRTFNPESLPRHLKGCHAKGEPEQEMEGDQARTPNPKRPKTLICYICGKEYGSASLEIHIKACQRKWDIEQQKKPPN